MTDERRTRFVRALALVVGALVAWGVAVSPAPELIDHHDPTAASATDLALHQIRSDALRARSVSTSSGHTAAAARPVVTALPGSATAGPAAFAGISRSVDRSPDRCTSQWCRRRPVSRGPPALDI
jgi:hypothetical protein